MIETLLEKNKKVLAIYEKICCIILPRRKALYADYRTETIIDDNGEEISSP